MLQYKQLTVESRRASKMRSGSTVVAVLACTLVSVGLLGLSVRSVLRQRNELRYGLSQSQTLLILEAGELHLKTMSAQELSELEIFELDLTDKVVGCRLAQLSLNRLSSESESLTIQLTARLVVSPTCQYIKTKDIVIPWPSAIEAAALD
ncbi:MAG: hypothetical protein KDB03_25555 [Planctomycetales bacterium]|nr:hypothetical protein [Planctomycetales bacterium]